MKKALFYTVILLFCTALGSLTARFPDNDVWARLIAGSYIIEHLALLKQDFLSYTPVHPWYDHEWGASAVFYLVFKYFGASGLVMLKGILAALTVFFCIKTVKVRSLQASNPYNILYYAFMFWAVSLSLGPVIRCLLFTCLFFSVFIYILERYRYKGGKCLLLLPFLMILWSNIHGGCISGLGLISIYIIGEALNGRSVKPYVYTLAGCLASLFVNPYGFEYVKFLFSAAAMNRSYISEWLSPFIKINAHSYLRYKLYLAFILLVQIIYLIKNKPSYKQLDKTKLLLLLAVTYLSAAKLRHITFFIFTAGTLMYDEFYSLFNAFINKIKPKNEIICSRFTSFKEICVYLFLLVFSIPILSEKEKPVRITETAYPRYAAEFVKINNLKGNLFISFDWGSYAAYKLYPDNLIVMDGRYEEVYYPELFNEMQNFHLLKGDWYKIIRDYKTDVMILEKKYGRMYDAMLHHPDWKCVFENNMSGVFVPAASVKQEYKYPVPDDDYYNNSVFDTRIFSLWK